MKNLTKQVGAVLLAMSDENVPLSKIVIQKFSYYLKVNDVPLNVRFVPYTYGPYSSDLSCELDKLVFWDKVKEESNVYEVFSLSAEDVDGDVYEKIPPYLNRFKSILDNNFEFDNVEVFGTVLYCVQSLLSSNDELNSEKVLNEFYGWKGDRYPKSRITEMFERLQ